MKGLGTYLIAGASLAGAAEAAPWVREQGGWYSRALVAHDVLEGANGLLTDVYAEYGLTPKLTLTAKTERVSFPDAAEFKRDSYRATLRRELFSHRGWVAGAEVGPVHGSTVTGVGKPCDGLGLETRLGAGWSGVSGKGLGRYAFADVAQISQADGCERSRIEIGNGQDITERFFLSQQLWFEEGNRSVRSIKTDTQFGIRINALDVSLGYREELGRAL